MMIDFKKLDSLEEVRGKIQPLVGEIIDLYGLRNVRGLEEKIAEMRKNSGDPKEIKFLELAVIAYLFDGFYQVEKEKK